MITEKTVDELITNLHNNINALEEAGESTKDATVSLPWTDYDKLLCDLKLWFAKVERLKEEILKYKNFIICANGQKGVHTDAVIEMIDKYMGMEDV